MKVWLFLLVMTLVACTTDDEPEQRDLSGIGFIVTDDGFNFKLTYPDGTVVTEKSSSVFGVFFNSLLDSDYSIGLHGGNDNLRFDFKYSIPKTVSWENEINGQHTLRTQRLTLQQTGNLQKLETEFWFDSRDDNEFDPYTNATGTITTKSDVLVDNVSIGIVVEVDAFIVNKDGERIKIEGLFWKRNAAIIS